MDELEAEAERRREEREAQRLEKLQEAKTLQEEDSQFLVKSIIHQTLADRYS